MGESASGVDLCAASTPLRSSHLAKGLETRISEGTAAMVTDVQISSICSVA